MKMKRFIYAILMIVGLAAVTSAQDFEYGSPSELKDLTAVYIDTGPDLESYNRIKDVITEAKLDLKFVTTVDASDFVIMFRGDSRLVQVGHATKEQATGKGFVAIPSADGKRARILMNFQSTQNRFKEKKPATKLAKDFVKAYKLANGLK
jgi:hypothetical protein